MKLYNQETDRHCFIIQGQPWLGKLAITNRNMYGNKNLNMGPEKKPDVFYGFKIPRFGHFWHYNQFL